MAFFSTYTNAVGSKLDSLSTKPGHCGVCHFDFNRGGTRNPYGAAVEAVYNANGSHTATNSASVFEDDFTAASSGSPSATGGRFYRISY